MNTKMACFVSTQLYRSYVARQLVVEHSVQSEVDTSFI